MYDSAIGHAVRTSFEAIAASNRPPSETELTALELRICAAVDELKGMGHPPERVIIRLKELANEVLPVRLAAEDRDALMARLIRCAIGHYFRDRAR